MERIDKLNALEKKYQAELTKDKVGNYWYSWWMEAPSRICKLYIGSVFYFHDVATNQETGEVLPEYEAESDATENLIRPLLTNEDWEYIRGYCVDGRYQKWITEMQAKAPDTHPEGWD